ncbi:hypothetical protein EVAR_23490_1 [Eumeta japonica]|uniref:Uncharacterized protein n=1 Tax=Eumeta variegata TaxID=151549 RepID=A0A4C1UJW4_EUMVA|nr:hypothetical protein EVAR_23490_1 [Eumeta japonica]
MYTDFHGNRLNRIEVYSLRLHLVANYNKVDSTQTFSLNKKHLDAFNSNEIGRLKLRTRTPAPPAERSRHPAVPRVFVAALDHARHAEKTLRNSTQTATSVTHDATNDDRDNNRARCQFNELDGN